MSEEELPEGWKQTPLDSLLEEGGLFDGPFGSNLKTSDYVSSGVRVVRLENLDNLRFIEEKRTYISLKKYEDLRKHTVAGGDVLFGSFLDDLPRVCLLPALDTPAIAKADCFCLRPRQDLVDRRFLVYQLGTLAARHALVEEIHGATRPRITTKQLRAFEIRLPPLTEQRRIVEKVEALLAQVNQARARLAKVPAILKRLRQSILSAACSGRLTEDWRGSFANAEPPTGTEAEPDSPLELPEAWRWLKASSLCDPARALTYGVIKLGPPVPDGVLTLRSSDVRPLFVDRNGVKRISAKIAGEYQRTTLRGGEVLVTVRGTLGGIAVAAADMAGWNVSREVAVLPVLPGRCLPSYLVFAMASIHCQNWLSERAKGVAYTGINIEDLKELPIPMAPLPEQHEIVRRVDALFKLADTIEAAVAAATARADKITQAILAKAFRGELVPTEAEVARQRKDGGRAYEPASALLARIRAERETNAPAPAKARTGRRPAKRVSSEPSRQSR